MTKELSSLQALSRVALAVCALTLAGCASTDQWNRANSPTATSAAVTAMPDRIEGYNRWMFGVNDSIDRHAIEPVARGYRDVTPTAFRTAVSNFLTNLKSPDQIGNQLLQGDINGAGTDTARFIINTTVGFLGCFDVAGANGLTYHPEDFGQTLAVWGVPNGTYLIIPIIGPSSLRDGTGLVVDSFADPVYWYFYNTHQEGWDYIRLGVTFLAAREELLDAVDDLRKNSFDYYAATRSAYAQHRAALISDGRSSQTGPAAQQSRADHP
jgi:phospholipid-binding lipoprotein MlaA